MASLSKKLFFVFWESEKSGKEWLLGSIRILQEGEEKKRRTIPEP